MSFQIRKMDVMYLFALLDSNKVPLSKRGCYQHEFRVIKKTFDNGDIGYKIGSTRDNNYLVIGKKLVYILDHNQQFIPLSRSDALSIATELDKLVGIKSK